SVPAVAEIKFVFPLHDHAEVLVIEDHRFGSDLLDMRRGEFLDVHQERAVAIDIDNLFVWTRDFGAERGWIPIAHSAEASAGEQLPRVFIFIILPGPHLMLADAGGDDRVTAGEF